MPQSDDSDDDDDALQPSRPMSNRKQPKPEITEQPSPVPAISRPKPMPPPMPVCEEKEQPLAKEESVGTLSHEFSSNEEKGGQHSVESLQRKIAKLKHQNETLRRQLGSGAQVQAQAEIESEASSGAVMARLEQNHRTLRYLHEWADKRLPDMISQGSHEVLAQLEGKSKSGSSRAGSGWLVHVLWLVLLTVCVLAWDSAMSDVRYAELEGAVDMFANVELEETLRDAQDVIVSVPKVEQLFHLCSIFINETVLYKIRAILKNGTPVP